MKKILFLIDNLKGGGAEKAIKIIVEGLQEKGVKPIVVLLENQKDYTLKDGIEIYTFTQNISKFNFIFLHFKLLKLLKELGPDIIYATNTKAQILSLLSTPFFDAQRVTNIQVDLTKQYEGRSYIFKIFAKLLRFTDFYSFISYGIYDNLKDKIPKKENIFIPNPIDFKEIDLLKNEPIEEEYQHIYEKKVFVTIGRLTEQKGQWVLLEAFAKIKDNVNLVILGSGEKEQELKELAQELGIENRVFFLGFQSNPFKFLQKADIFVLSSLWEGFGNVIVEAMRCELPIISTDCPSGPREILAPSSDIFKRLKSDVELAQHGVLCSVDDADSLHKAMDSILQNNDLALKYKKAAINRAKDFSSNIIVDKFIQEVLKD